MKFLKVTNASVSVTAPVCLLVTNCNRIITRLSCNCSKLMRDRIPIIIVLFRRGGPARSGPERFERKAVCAGFLPQIYWNSQEFGDNC